MYLKVLQNTAFHVATHKTVPTYWYWNAAITDHFYADDIGITTPGDLENMDTQIQY